MEFKKAEKSQLKLRLAIFGPSGSGKTYSSLAIATGISKRVALIDTERGSASMYADRFDFDVIELPARDIDTYVEAILLAEEHRYEVLIIDSLSHAWKDLLAEIDRIAKVKFRGNTWSAWSEGTPKQAILVDTLLGFPGHIIGTMRTKTEWVTEQTSKGKIRPVRVGLAPEQGKGIEYEFDLLVEINEAHFATVIKDRTGKFQDKPIEMPGLEFGKELAVWLNEETTHWSEDKGRRARFVALMEKDGIPVEALFLSHQVEGWAGMTAIRSSGKEAYKRAKEFHLATLAETGPPEPPPASLDFDTPERDNLIDFYNRVEKQVPYLKTHAEIYEAMVQVTGKDHSGWPLDNEIIQRLSLYVSNKLDNEAEKERNAK